MLIHLYADPHAIPSRMTIGHVFECVSSKLAAMLGIRIDATAFSHKPVEEICNLLKKAGYSEDGKEVMYHPHTGKRLKGRVFIGPTYYQRLKHMVGDKIHARAKGKIVGLTRQPVDGRANGGGKYIHLVNRFFLCLTSFLTIHIYLIFYRFTLG